MQIFLNRVHNQLLSIMIDENCIFQLGYFTFLMSKRIMFTCTFSKDQLGRLIQLLKDHGVYNNTVIFYTADNGPHQVEWN